MQSHELIIHDKQNLQDVLPAVYPQDFARCVMRPDSDNESVLDYLRFMSEIAKKPINANTEST
ncbi:MAG: hypothetical protein COX79_02890 [Candidatus Levybacteria bacterium CG_4_10_14_0_2_um_filter_36_16]|nr:MAG: hypothetical protein AUK12_01110 [Candidatus Levybacteria bacterium CG2_30_37_29]PIR79581.1 MAG: hypothetical protein COU26_00310 [Candidatus Levybacteria bacterium CG10_big_fil_rev_8_21_14_0_10_36_30]PIZ97271.1 MAG: hypothetical protein COX79_02890 [Candidatus Levybacteria bacterium CG_4_10_14_0_2_um_filter_36_16]PJA90949.1 MAG: hypothetical protein CO136_00080 [Candidatus Levybacteria bacterium CG_4_9_14_3_um_filter_36_7]